MQSHDELMAAAREQTGLDDFGDESFQDGLERLVASLRTEARLNEIGELAMPALIVKLLTQRLHVEDWYRRHPEIDDEPVVAPLIGLGLPRTGSTALSNLLAEDPNARSLIRWQACEPCPPPSTVTGDDPRIARARAEAKMQSELAPRLDALVPASPMGPEECQDLMALDFKAHYFQAFAHVPSYSAWLTDADLTSTYLYERRVLKLLQWGLPTKPWRLKCPSHLLWLDHLDHAFPDARFVMTHRDPTDVMVSVADVYAEVGAMFSDDIDHDYLGRLNVEQWSTALQRLQEFRDGGADDRFFDIDFQAVQRQPFDEVRALYGWLGEPVTEEFDTGMARWWERHAETREQNIHPDPSVFGLDLEAVASCFAGYRSRVEGWLAGST